MCTSYLDWTLIGHAQHQDLFKHSISVLDSSDSMDGPNVNWVFFSELCNYWRENDTSKLHSTRSCSLHAIHDAAFKPGEQSTDQKLKKVLRALHQILHDSSARQNDYGDVTGSSWFPLPFCGTQWIKDEHVAVQAIEIWDDICQLCTFWQSLPKGKWLSSI